VLPQPVRMRSRDDFTRAVRRGVRVGTATVVVHAWSDPEADHGPLVGFVVSKAVGTAVTRNRVKRRLRHLVRERLADLPTEARLVVRANPAAASKPERLPLDLDYGWKKSLQRLQSPAPAASGGGR
jgi:ribonuclease P protein component